MRDALPTWQLQEAKARFSELVRCARAQGPQRVTVHGRDAVVVIAAEDYRESGAQRPDFRSFLLSGPRVDGLDIDRPSDTGRDIEL